MDYNLQLDRWHLVTEQMDGGDSANRTSVLLTVHAWQDDHLPSWAKSALADFTHAWIPGILRRHPDTTKWYGDWQRMSRDQTFPYLMCCKEYKEYKYVFKYILGHSMRGFLLATNIRNNGATKENNGQSYGNGTYDYSLKLPDVTGPDFWSVEIRSLPTWMTVCLYPSLLIFDLYTLGSAYYLRYYNKSQTDVINHVMLSIFSAKHCPTPWTWLMNKFINNAADLQARLDAFFAYEYQPKMNLLVKPLVSKYFLS